MVDPPPWRKSKDGLANPEGEVLNLPTPHEPLREWTEQNIDHAAIIAAMEAVMQIARSQPDFEERRLAQKTAARFRY
jgi:hypothetical protein